MWQQVKTATGLEVLCWWELVVKPNLKKLLIERGKELNKEKFGELNLLQIRQAYLVKKIQAGSFQYLAHLHYVHDQMNRWHKEECEKVKIQSKCDEVSSAENVRIYHHELHRKHINRSSILKLETEENIYNGHDECSRYLEEQVAHLLLQPAGLDSQAQEELLKEIQPVFTAQDNAIIIKTPTKEEVKSSVSNSNLFAAPGTDGITPFLPLLGGGGRCSHRGCSSCACW